MNIKKIFKRISLHAIIIANTQGSTNFAKIRSRAKEKLEEKIKNFRKSLDKRLGMWYNNNVKEREENTYEKLYDRKGSKRDGK